MKIKALAFVLMAVLLLCGCGQKSETAAATPAQAVTASAAQSSTVRPVSTGVTPEQFGAKGDGIADDLRMSGSPQWHCRPIDWRRECRPSLRRQHKDSQ